jgi:hypothetical protein
LAGVLFGTFVSFLLGVFQPAAGPDWLWAGGRTDPIRALYFRQDGRFRRFGRVALLATLAAGSGAIYWMLTRF